MSALPAEVRTRAYEDALRDLQDNCVKEHALEGPLRRHCIQQAKFVLQFPECAAGCQLLARTVLPQARR